MANETKLSPAEQRVKDYLDNYAAQDAVFAIKYMTSGKTLKGCINYITKQAKEAAKSGRTYFADDAEVFGWCVHYFDEDSLNEEKSAPTAKVTTSNSPDEDDVEEEAAISVAAPAPKPAKTAKPKKAAAPKTAKPAAPAPTATVVGTSTEGDDEVIDLFAGLFD